MKYTELCQKLHKRSAAMLTPQAQQAAIQPPAPPMDPSMMGAGGGMPPGGAPMDPAMMGGAPMDPAMAGGMPPGGAPPMDPSMMGAGGGMPPQGGGAWMQDPMFMEFLMQMGIQVDPNTGAVISPDGQQLPPQMMDQMYAQFQAQMQQAGMDPSMMGAGGGMPPGGAPMDPAMMGGAPMDPAMAGGMPPQGQMPPQDQMPPQAQDPAAMQQEFLNQTAGMLQDIVDTVMEEKISVLQSKITAFNEKLDTIKTLLDDILTDRTKEDKQKAEQRAVNDQLQRELKNTQEVQPVQVMPTETLLAEEQPAQVPMNMLDVMRGV